MGSFSAMPTSDFAKRYLSVLDPAEDMYQISESDQVIAVEMSTLTDLLNRDINLNTFGVNEPKVSVQIIPQ